MKKIHILANIIKIVVLTTSTNTLLRVTSSLKTSKRTGRVNLIPKSKNDTTYLSKENRLILIHTSICKQQSRIIQRNDRRRTNKSMFVLFKELNEGLKNLRRRPL